VDGGRLFDAGHGRVDLTWVLYGEIKSRIPLETDWVEVKEGNIATSGLERQDDEGKERFPKVAGQLTRSQATRHPILLRLLTSRT
jgi:hypothetical protein